MKKLLIATGLIFSACMLYAQDNGKDYTTQFPNYHPLIVHFPLVLLIVAAFMQAARFFFKSNEYNIAITAITIAGFITACMSTTVFHAHPAHNIRPVAHTIFMQHIKFANYTVWLAGIASAIKLISLFTKNIWIQLLALLALWGAAITVVIAGHHGAELVYKQGIGPQGNRLDTDHDD